MARSSGKIRVKKKKTSVKVKARPQDFKFSSKEEEQMIRQLLKEERARQRKKGK